MLWKLIFVGYRIFFVSVCVFFIFLYMGKNIIICMNVIQIKEKINDGKNLIFYNKSIFDCYEALKDDYLCIYFNEPTPVKVRLIKLINELSPDNKHSLNRLTIA